MTAPSRCARGFGGVICVWVALAAGCGKTEPPPASETNMRRVAVLYTRYITEHKGEAPDKVEAFKEFARKNAAMLDITDVDAVLTSPRDGQPYVIRVGIEVPKSKGGPTPGKSVIYKAPVGGGEAPKGGIENPMVAYEKVGVDGKKFAVFLNSMIEEVDETRLKQLLAKK